MKNGLAFLLLLVMSTSLQANEVSWLTSYPDALELARTTGRPLLLVMSRDADLRTSGDRLSPGESPALSRDPLNAYVLCKVDVNSDYGKRVAEAYRVTQFPHSVIIDKTVKWILYSKAGRATDDAWKATLIKYQGEAIRQEVAETQPQPAVRTQSPTTYRTQSQTTVRSQSQVSGRTQFFGQPSVNFFRAPAFCNT